MKESAFRRAAGVILLASLAFGPVTASACSVCMGDPSSKAAGAINGAIFLLMGFIGCVLGSVAVFGLSLRKRAGGPVPPHVELSRMMHSDEEEN